MAESGLTHVNLPLTIAESIHMTGVPAGPIKLLLIAESQREGDLADIPVRRVRTMGGWTPKNLFVAVRGLDPVRARWISNPGDPGAGVPAQWSPFVEPPVLRFDGEDERLFIRFSKNWVTACRGATIAVPLDDIRALKLRAAVLIRLRMEAALHGQDRARVRWPMNDLAMLSGRDGDIDPARHLVPDAAAGVIEIGQVSSTISVDMDILTSRSGQAVDRLDPNVIVREGRTRAVVMKARRLRPRRVGTGAKVASEPHAPASE